jgi:hypothetical protein
MSSCSRDDMRTSCGKCARDTWQVMASRIMCACACMLWHLARGMRARGMRALKRVASSCGMRHAASGIWHVPRAHALMPPCPHPSSCGMRHATCGMRHATCGMWHVLHAPCSRAHATGRTPTIIIIIIIIMWHAASGMCSARAPCCSRAPCSRAPLCPVRAPWGAWHLACMRGHATRGAWHQLSRGIWHAPISGVLLAYSRVLYVQDSS